MIESVLATAGVGYGALARVAVCTGPGSFTGARIGVAAARGLALSCGIPAIGISRFEALAAEAAGPVAVCLAGRGGWVYLQSFDAAGRAMGAPAMVAAAALGDAVPAAIARFAGDAAALLAGDGALLDEGLPDPLVIARLARSREAGPLPAPLYLRGADAEPSREGPPVWLD